MTRRSRTSRKAANRLDTLESWRAATSGSEPDFSLSEDARKWLDSQSPDLSDPDVRDEIERRAAEIEARGPQSSKSDPHSLTAEEKAILDMSFGPPNDTPRFE